jgi:hypothetical protein
MYRRLAAGEFGNTTPQYFDLETWERDRPKNLKWWGVRTLTPGGPCYLNCPESSIPDVVLNYRAQGHRINISMMVDKVTVTRAWLEIFDSPSGLVVEGIEWPDTRIENWRTSMPDPRRRRAWKHTAARLVLKRHLNENDLDDLEILIKNYPDHVIELSALDSCLGTIPHRRGIVWEVRKY